MSELSITNTRIDERTFRTVASVAGGPGGAVATAVWRTELVGPLAEPFACRISEISSGVHDPLPRRRGDSVADPACAVLGGRPCLWRRAHDVAEPVLAFVSYGQDALEEALLGLLAELA